MSKYQPLPVERTPLRRAGSGSQRASRSEPRTTFAFPIRFEDRGASHDAIARNVSLGGMFVETTTPAAFGSQVTVELDLGLGEPVSVRCFVRWTHVDGMGVQFGVMGARETHALTTLLARARSA